MNGTERKCVLCGAWFVTDNPRQHVCGDCEEQAEENVSKYFLNPSHGTYNVQPVLYDERESSPKSPMHTKNPAIAPVGYGLTSGFFSSFAGGRDCWVSRMCNVREGIHPDI